MALTIVTPAAMEPVSRDELKAHLRLDTADQEITEARSINPATYPTTGSIVGSTVNITGARATFLIAYGALGPSDSLIVTLQESIDGSAWSDIDFGVASSGPNSGAETEYLYVGDKPYLRAVAQTVGDIGLSVSVAMQPRVAVEDALLDGLITAARIYAERATRRVLVTTGMRLTLDSFCESHWSFPTVRSMVHYSDLRIALQSFCEIRFPVAPVQSVSAVRYTDTQGVTQTLGSYQLDTLSEPARLHPAYGTVWPATRCQTNAVQIDFTAGYTEVPTPAKQAIKMLAAHWYANREAVSEKAMTTVPMSVDLLLSTLKWEGY